MPKIPPVFALDANGFRLTLPKKGVLIGLDPGRTLTGVAISDPWRNKAHGVGVIESAVPEQAARKIRRLSRHTIACGVVCGYPVLQEKKADLADLSWRSHLVTSVAALYRNKFYKDTQIQGFLFWHEEDSTMVVKRRIPLTKTIKFILEGSKDRKIKEKLDMDAAEYILQDALNRITALNREAGETENEQGSVVEAVQFQKFVRDLRKDLPKW